jgi:hypothetical protein
MADNSGEEVLGRMRSLSEAAAGPLRRYFERRAERQRVNAECSEIRKRVNDELQELHDQLWHEWGPNVFFAAKRRLEEISDD